MINYLISRLFRWATGLLLVLFVSYGMMYYGASDPITRMYEDMEDGGIEVDESVRTALQERFGLDKTFPEQFIAYLGKLSQGELGDSIRERRSVNRMVAVRLPISMQIGFAAGLLGALMGIPLGVIAALNHNRFWDQFIVGFSVFINAIPIYVTAPILLLFFVVVLGVMNVPYGWEGIFHPQVILPIFVLSLSTLPTLVRQTRAAMLEVMNEDYIRTARSKGLSNRIIIMRHMLRPVLTPVVTSIGLILISMVNGALFIELLFNIPGFGKLSIQGFWQVDYSVIMATILIGTLIVMVGNFLVDLAYPLLDPRVTRD